MKMLTPYLGFDGKCKEAFSFYEKVLGGKIAMMMTYADTPMSTECTEAMRGQIAHARLVWGEAVLMGGDAPPGQFTRPAGFCVNIGVEDPKEADRIFAAMAEGGKIQMPIAETFWAHRFGMLIDRYGTPWMVNCEKAA